MYKILDKYPYYKIFPDGKIVSIERYIERKRGGQIFKMKLREHTMKWYLKKSRGKITCATVMLKDKNEKVAPVRVHRLVLEAFKGKCPDGMEGCHNDGNSLNNNLSNLRWDTHLNNMKDSEKHGTKTKPPISYGEKHHNTTLTIKDIIKIRSFKIERGIYTELARVYNCSSITIKRIMNYETWKYKESFNN